MPDALHQVENGDLVVIIRCRKPVFAPERRCARDAEQRAVLDQRVFDRPVESAVSSGGDGELHRRKKGASSPVTMSCIAGRKGRRHR